MRAVKKISLGMAIFQLDIIFTVTAAFQWQCIVVKASSSYQNGESVSVEFLTKAEVQLSETN